MIKQYRRDGRPIIYLDETYIHSSHVSSKGWSDSSSEGLRQPLGKRDRLIVLHAGGEFGFINGGMLIFKSGNKTGDYHSEMNFENFMKWFSEKLIPNLPEKSVIVIDNAPYHNVVLDKPPTSNSKKEDMRNWLHSKGIPTQSSMLRSDLLALVNQHKPTFKRYAIDEAAMSKGHNVLRLPPYHPDLNPIELVWASLKQHVGKYNVTFKLNDVKKLCDEFFHEFSAEEWATRCRNAIKCEDEFLEREGRLDDLIDKLIIEVDTASEGSESDSDLSGVELL